MTSLLSIVLLSVQCVQAAQITFEDYFMADLHIEPLKIVGYEGLFGSITMICVLLPLVALVKGHDGDGLHEDSLETLHVSPPCLGLGKGTHSPTSCPQH